MNKKNSAVFQLTILTLIHFCADMLGGIIPGTLPVLIGKYNFSIAAASFLVTLYLFSGNAVQVPAGLTRKKASFPLLIHVGMLLSALLLFMWLIPQGETAYWWFVVLIVICGIGGAVVHPEALRCVCAVDSKMISPSTATAFFVTAGFFGYNCGPLIAGVLIEWMGLPGLMAVWLLIIPLCLLLLKTKIRMADGAGNTGSTDTSPALRSNLTFWEIFACSVCINAGCSIIQGLLPAYLETCGYSLTFCGFSALLFGIGAGLGALFTGSILVKRYSVLACIQKELYWGVPLLLVYILSAAHSPWMCILNFFAGAAIGAGFPQLVVLSRSAANGPALGVRMGLIVGGTWSIAGIILWGTGLLADLMTLRLALLVSPCCLLAALVLFWLFSAKSTK